MAHLKTHNKDVPTEAILKQAFIENGQLKAEIDFLKDEIKKRDDAIAAFKKWQSRMAAYKVDYWLTEGVKLIHEPIDMDRVKAIRLLIKRNSLFYSRLETLEKTLDKYIAQKEIANKACREKC